MIKESKFILIFLIIASVLYVLVSITYHKNFLIIGTNNVALTANEILNFLGIKTILIDNNKIYLFESGMALEIILECTGVYEMIILSSIILAYPTHIRNKLFGIIFGIVTIYILNMIRIISISYVLLNYADKFDFVDKYLWQTSLVIFISLTYIIWLKSIGRSSSSYL